MDVIQLFANPHFLLLNANLKRVQNSLPGAKGPFSRISL
jgi:hypothetical protein